MTKQILIVVLYEELKLTAGEERVPLQRANVTFGSTISSP
jgi:hypothetical protein